MHEQSQLEAAISRATAAEALAAEYGLALDILGRLAGVTSERAVADIVLEFAQVVFGANLARMTMLDRWGRGRRAWELGLSGTLAEVDPPAIEDRDCRVLEVTEGGLRVPVLAGDRPLARIDIEDLAQPGDVTRYATTVWIIAKVAAMAIVGVRAARGLVPICAGCKSVRDERGAWHPLERWISSTSEVELSHGLCPTCLERAEREAGLEPEDTGL